MLFAAAFEMPLVLLLLLALCLFLVEPLPFDLRTLVLAEGC